MSDVYSYTAKALDGSDINLDRYRGDVLLVVNTASKCGFTPQFEGLQKLHADYAARGLKVLGFPCNQFGQQEPGSSVEIGSFCQQNYGVDFQMFDKIDVNGGSAHPLYKHLTEEAPGLLGIRDIKWNFTKFLIGKDGHVVKRYAPTVAPADIQEDIEKLL